MEMPKTILTLFRKLQDDQRESEVMYGLHMLSLVHFRGHSYNRYYTT